jgi:hypothetical protein
VIRASEAGNDFELLAFFAGLYCDEPHGDKHRGSFRASLPNHAVKMPFSLPCAFRGPLIATLSVVLLAHLPMLICDTVLWDSAAIKYMQESGVNEGVRARASQEGMPYVGEFHIAFGRLPYAWHLYRFAAFGCFAATTIGIYLVLSVCPGLSKNEAAAISAMSLLFPSFVLWQEPIMIFQALCVAVFWIAAAWRLQQLRRPAAPPLAVAATIVLFFFSFIIESLLVFFYVVLAYFFFATPSVLPFKSRVVEFVRRNWLFAIIPFVFFFAKRAAAPTHSIYSTYNSIHLNDLPMLVIKGLVANAKRMLIEQALDLVRFAREQPSFFLGLACLCVVPAVVLSTRLFPASPRPSAGRKILPMLLFCGAAYCAAVFPYAVVGKFPLVNNFNARLAILIWVPISAAFVIAVSSWTSRPRIVQAVYGIALGLLILLTVRDQVLWQNRFIKYLAVRENLRDSEADLANTIIFTDQARFGMPETFLVYELNWIMYHAWNNLRHLGFDAARSTPEMMALWRNNAEQKATIYPDFQYDGRISRVTILPGRSVGEWEIYRKYFWGPRAELGDFLRSLVQLHIEPPKKEIEQ